MNTRNIIFKYVDSPSRIAFWTVDEAQALFIPISLGLLFSFALTGLVISIISYVALKYIKLNVGEGLVKHAVYWYLPKRERRLRYKVPSYIREYIG